MHMYFDCTIPSHSDLNIVQNIIDTHMARETFLSEKRRTEIKNILLSVDETTRKQPLFVRTFISIFIPYPSVGLLETNEIDAM
jgi:hypothetical protein